MEKTPLNIDPVQLLSKILSDVAAEVPIHLNEDEDALLSVFLRFSKFPSLNHLLEDIDCFLNEELDLRSITRDNVSKINFSALATKFGKRYGLASFAKMSGSKANEVSDFGWKTIRTIFLKVLHPQLQKIPFADAQQLLMVLEEFICSYSIIQGTNAEDVLDNIKFWEVFKKYKFTLELDTNDTIKPKELPAPDEFIRWAGRVYTVKEAGRALERDYGLIVDQNQWIDFFHNHTGSIEVVSGQLNKLVAVLWQIENHFLIDKSKNKGCWKIWQLILVDNDGNLFSQELRKISSKIRGEKSQKDQVDNEFGKEVIAEMMRLERDNSLTIGDNDNKVE